MSTIFYLAALTAAISLWVDVIRAGASTRVTNDRELQAELDAYHGR